MSDKTGNVVWFEKLARGDVGIVGGKNASLGEMIGRLAEAGVRVPPGFATSAAAYRAYIAENKLDGRIGETLDALEAGKLTLREAGRTIREAFLAGEWPEAVREDILAAHRELARRCGGGELAVAVRSSATAEDLPEASFAGQQETFLNVRGEDALLDACRRCYASLYTDRAIAYRRLKGFADRDIALSIGVQRMVRSDIGCSGVMFSLDTETGCDRVVLINGAWGLGETVVQGTVDPDEFMVFKPFLTDGTLLPIVEKSLGAKERKLVYAADGATQDAATSQEERDAFTLSDAEVLELARHACAIEDHYGCPMDMEWARDGETGELFIVQARPETVQSRAATDALTRYRVKPAGPKLVSGISIGQAAVTGRVCVVASPRDIDRFEDGAILVTGATDPDWAPIMKRAAAIVTDHGGRTSHAAIVSRELGLPAVVGTGNATSTLKHGQEVTVSCAGGADGVVYDGKAEIERQEIRLDEVPETKTHVMLNLADPSAAMRWWRLPTDGVGLARMEFVISNAVKAHPLALSRYDSVSDPKVRAEIDALTRGYADRRDYFVERLSVGLARIAAVCHPHPVIVRMSDFKTNEYAALIGGAQFEPDEENPMLGFRGASRYYSDRYRDGFDLECRAIRRLRDTLGFRNVAVMIPFCRTTGEADRVLAVMAENGLERGRDGLEVLVMCEIPSNVIRAEAFAERFDGFSIGSNDLTQLTLGVDRDSDVLAELFDERDPAVTWMIETVIGKAHAAKSKVGFCGQAPSDDPAFAALLVGAGIDSISVAPDSFLSVKLHVAEAERAKG